MEPEKKIQRIAAIATFMYVKTMRKMDGILPRSIPESAPDALLICGDLTDIWPVT